MHGHGNEYYHEKFVLGNWEIHVATILAAYNSFIKLSSKRAMSIAMIELSSCYPPQEIFVLSCVMRDSSALWFVTEIVQQSLLASWYN